jgi:hypothetical protein
MAEERRSGATTKVIVAKSILRLAGSSNGGEVRLSGPDWNILTQVNGVRTVVEIGRRLHLAEADIVATMSRLAVAGLVEVCERPETAPAGVPAALLAEIRLAFARLVGPLAPMLVDEAIEDMGEDAESLPRHRLAGLIEALAEQVSDETKRVQFQQSMLDLLRRA